MPKTHHGLLASLSSLTNTLIDIVQTRIELLSLDIEEDRTRIFQLVLIYMAALFSLVVGFVIVITLTVFLLWEKNQLDILFLIGGIFVLLGVAILGLATYKAKNKPGLFLSSLLALEKDKQEIASD